MARPIPVSVSHSSGFAPLDQLVLDLFWVTQDGGIARELGRVPVVDGVAVYDGPPLPDAQLRWALRLTDLPTSAPVYRSGPLRRLPGAGPGPLFSGRIRVHRGGGVLSLDEGDGAPGILIDHVRDNLPPPLEFGGVDLGSDEEGNYLVRLHGRLRIPPSRKVVFSYERRLRIAPSRDPGHPRRVAVVWPQGPPRGLGAVLGWLRPVLDELLTAAAEAQMTGMGYHIGSLMLFASGIDDFQPQTVSLGSLLLSPSPPYPQITTLITLCAGAITGTVVPDVPLHPIEA